MKKSALLVSALLSLMVSPKYAYADGPDHLADLSPLIPIFFLLIATALFNVISFYVNFLRASKIVKTILSSLALAGNIAILVLCSIGIYNLYDDQKTMDIIHKKETQAKPYNDSIDYDTSTKNNDRHMTQAILIAIVISGASAYHAINIFARLKRR